MNKLHIISFDIPFPPNYGGVIDVFYKIKELHQLNVKIYLHVFSKDKEPEIELNKYCEEVYYYSRRNTLISCFSLLPFRVKSRSNKKLITNINKTNAPVLYEGLHSAYLLSKNKFKKNYLRAHNIEHTYFYGLAKSEKNIFKKIFFFIEATKLSFFEKHIKKADGIFSISNLEQTYFLEKYGEKSTYIPAFHDATFNNKKTNSNEKFVLWHGDLRVADNEKSVLFLIETFKNSPFTLKIASSVCSNRIKNIIKKTKNIIYINLENNKTLTKLLNEAHVNVLYTYQNTGIKLKLLNALYKGKFVIGNDKLIIDTGLENICELANTKEEIIKTTTQLFQQEFTNTNVDYRKNVLEKFSPKKAAEKIVTTIF